MNHMSAKQRVLRSAACGAVGLGLARGTVGTENWSKQCADWLRGLGLLE